MRLRSDDDKVAEILLMQVVCGLITLPHPLQSAEEDPEWQLALPTLPHRMSARAYNIESVSRQDEKPLVSTLQYCCVSCHVFSPVRRIISGGHFAQRAPRVRPADRRVAYVKIPRSCNCRFGSLIPGTSSYAFRVYR
jgi:hypothetical protein